ncbi:MAG TPA: pilin [Burkholderiales bacterium]
MGRIDRQSGFTLIEVMIVVAVIGILAAVAMPAFRDYAARAKVTEALVQLSNCRNTIQEIYMSGGALPGVDNWGCESDNPSKFVERISTTNEGIIKVTLGGSVNDLRLAFHDITMAPMNASGQVMGDLDVGSPVRVWRCGNTSDGTDLNPNFLPASCRGI